MMSHLPRILIQVGAILLAARCVGLIFRKLGQPQVMGEMIAGILLGPSLLGWALPGVSAALFPPESLGSLNSLSQVGLLLFMFLVGLELDPVSFGRRGHSAVLISHASIGIPFFLGVVLALYLYPRLADDSVRFTHFALFLGTAMSVTAFPVLARILTERNLLRSDVGAMTIACAAVDDVTAWCILAGVSLLVHANGAAVPLWLTVGGSVAYVIVMLWVARKALRRLEINYRARGEMTQDMLAIVLLLLWLSAAVTEWLGIHALFGAFLMGVVMPRSQRFRRVLSEKLHDIAVVLLLPLYFAFTGLRTNIGSLSGTEMGIYFTAIVGIAIAGKFGGATLSARLTGMTWRESGAIGILMNTRGLMELVVLNIGLDLGIISPALFAMMTLMALVTTFLTTPVLEWIYPVRLYWTESAVIDRFGLGSRVHTK